MYQLTEIIKRDLLVLINGLGPASGQELKETLEEQYGTEINHSRLYPNLDQLADLGLIKKKTETGSRRNAYTITDRGRRELAAYHGWMETHLRGE